MKKEKEYIKHFNNMQIVTSIDELIGELSKKGEILIEDIYKRYGWDEKKTNEILNILEKKGWCKIVYPVNIMANPKIIKTKEFHVAIQKPESKFSEIVEMYNNFCTICRLKKIIKEAKIPVMICRLPNIGLKYYIHPPRLQEPTKSFIEHVKEQLSSKTLTLIESEKTTNKNEKIRLATIIKTKSYLNKYFEDAQSDLLTVITVSDLIGLGAILESIMLDENIEELVINKAKEPIAVYHKKYGWMQTNQTIDSEEEIFNISSSIAQKSGKQITLLNPLLDARLSDGDRVNSTLYPISTQGNTITIRKFSKEPWTIIDFIGNTVDINITALLWQACHYEMNILVVGGTASGKTTMLNSILPFIPFNQRIISIEDTREINLPKEHWNWVSLLTRTSNIENVGRVTMLDLMINSLRMRPDRIILGEMRKEREAEVLFEAMHTGHSVYATMHADTAEQAIRRLVNPPFSMPPTELEVLNLILVQYRNRRDNKRRVSELCEVNIGARNEIITTPIWRWVPAKDTFEFVNKPVKYLQELNLHTGMTEKEFDKDIKERVKILKWMVKNKIRHVDDIGSVMKAYYLNKNKLISLINKKGGLNQIKMI